MAGADFLDRIRRGKQARSLGAAGAVGSVLLFTAAKLISAAGGTLSAVLGILFAASVALVGWALLWIRESKEPFQYTYSLGKFEQIPSQPEDAGPVPDDPIVWLANDLKEKLSARVLRLSLLDEKSVPEAEPGGPPASHVHVSGWYGFRKDSQGWEFEVVPEVRLGGVGAPARLASSVRFRLDESTSCVPEGEDSPQLTEIGYGMLFERVYWSVASQIYAQIQRGVEQKVKLLPRGSLRASAYIHEADDYATSNTLDAYAAAQELYRRALEIYDLKYREQAASPWRQRVFEALSWADEMRRRYRRFRAGIWRKSGRREVMTASAELGLARMLVAAWHLGQLCGIPRKDIYEATEYVDNAIARLDGLPADIPEQKTTLFRAHVTLATIRLLLQDHPGAHDALEAAERLMPTRVHQDPDYLFVAGMIEPDRLLSLRLFGKAIDLEPTMELALFYWAHEYDEIWRRREKLESEVAEAVDAGYLAVLALNPGNISAWARRGYLGWLLAKGDQGEERPGWRAMAISALQTGRQYKEVRRDASVAELDWNMTRLKAESGKFAAAYRHYIEAVSARLADPRIDFEESAYLTPTKSLVNRFWQYQQRVLTKAAAVEADPDAEISPRLVKSVKSFVLNDCGLAYKAHYERSGSEESWTKAWNAFTDAQRENDAFVLPGYNLARLFRLLSEFPTSGIEVRREALENAAALLKDVLRREPTWAPARLLTVEVQTALADTLKVEREAKEQAARKATPGDGVTPVDSVRSARFDHLADERQNCLRLIEDQLRDLLPHNQIHDRKVCCHEDEVCRIDTGGKHVEALVDDPAVAWTKDFDAFHVAALTHWAGVLAKTAPEAADMICGKLRKTYSRGEGKLLGIHLGLADVLSSRDQGNEEAQATKKECEELLQRIVVAALKLDPVHLMPLKGTVWLPTPQRRELLATALKNEPSATTLIWIGETQVEMADFDRAIATFEILAKQDSPLLAPLAKLRLAGLLEMLDRQQEAFAALRQAADSPDPSMVAEAVAGLGRILREQGEAEAARAEYLGVASRCAVAMQLALRLERESQREEALMVYRAAIEAAEEEDVRAEARFRLALSLMSEGPDVSKEAEDLLCTLFAGQVEPFHWQAGIVLAQMRAESDRPQAILDYQQVLKTNDPHAIALAAWGLAAIAPDAGEAETAQSILLRHARRNPLAAEKLADWKRERGDEDVEDFLRAAGVTVPAAA